MIKLRKVMLYVTVVFFLIFTNKSTVWGNEDRQVLFIGSYSYNFESFNKQIYGFEKELNSDINTHIEYLDYGNFPSEGNEENFYNLLKYKMDKYDSYDAIILAEDHAIRFWEKYKDSLFKDIPMIFMGANDNELIQRVLAFEHVYGIGEDIIVEKSIELINHLHPSSNVVALVYSHADQSEELKEFYEVSGKFKSLDFNHISVLDNGINLTREKLKELPRDSVILEFYTSDANHVGYDTICALKDFMHEEVNLPTHGTIDFGMNENYVGGLYTDPIRQGSKAAQLVNKIVEGKEPESKFVDPSEVNTYTFNYNAMKTFNVREHELPKDSLINDKPTSMWESNKEYVVATIVVGLSLLITIIILIKINMKKNQYEKEILRAKTAAEDAHRAQSNFISTVSHELRTPVAVIMSCSQLLDLNLGKQEANLSDDTENVDIIRQNFNTLDIVKQNCNRMIKIVNNIIDVAKYDSKVMKPKFKNLEIISFIESIVELVIPYANSKNIELIFDTQCEELITAVDPYMIERIVLNLLSNAIKFSKDKGNILVDVFIINDKLVFSVEDNGIGIEKDDIDKIFERFIQLEDTTNRKNEGSGIGLSLVKSLVKLHDGQIKVESVVNQGTIFTIELPIRVLDSEEVLNYYHSKDSTYLKTTEIEFSDIL